jgi:hypothetical protein
MEEFHIIWRVFFNLLIINTDISKLTSDEKYILVTLMSVFYKNIAIFCADILSDLGKPFLINRALLTPCQETINPFQSNFSATRILPSSYLFWAGKILVDYL